MKELENLFEQYTGKQPETVTLLSGSGSNRRYFRLSNAETSLIGVEGTSIEENKAFIVLCNHFRKQGLLVPQILAQTDDSLFYLQQDLGNTSLFDEICEGRKTAIFSEKEKDLLKQTIAILPDFQFKGAKDMDFSICYPQPEFDKRTVFWDLNYFKYYFLKVSEVDFQEDLLETDFEKLSTVLLQNETDTFLYRDLQSRNVMIHEDKPYFIDFQGGRKGPVYYDVASFLWQAKANFSEELRDELLAVYLKALSKYQPETDVKYFKKQLQYFVLFRILQVLGAYGFRGYIEKKSHFIESIPYALNNLKKLFQNTFPEIPYLQKVLQNLSEMNVPLSSSETKNKSVKPDENSTNQLVITVYSFSYKKGIPQDSSGNGGGYVFDCRAIHNPGRYDEYKQLTGLEQPVIDFLEEDGEISIFLKEIYKLADQHIERYIERGFTSLMFSFGCTGGQHRSVYSAQHLGEYIAENHNVKVIIKHREQDRYFE